MKKSIIILAIFIFSPITVYANSGSFKDHFYMGGGLGASIFNGNADFKDFDKFEIDNKQVSGKIFGGYQFHKNIAIEIGLHRFGSVLFGEELFEDSYVYREQFNFKSKGISLSFLGIVPINEKIKIFLKTGMLYSNLKGEDIDYFTDKDAFTFLLGMGLNFDLTENFFIRPEIEWSPNVMRSSGDGEVKISKINYCVDPNASCVRGSRGGLHYDTIVDAYRYNPAPDVDILSFTFNFGWRF